MWPFKKNRGISICPGENVGLEIRASWKNDKDEVMIMTEKGPVTLDGTSECFIDIKSSNANPVKIQIIPDFKKRELNFVEVLDPSIKADDKSPRLIFTGVTERRAYSPIDDIIERLDNDMTEFEMYMKRYRFIKNIIVAVAIIMIAFNIYLFIVRDDTGRYINLFSVIILSLVTYYMLNSYKRMYKNYQELKRCKDKIFETIEEI